MPDTTAKTRGQTSKPRKRRSDVLGKKVGFVDLPTLSSDEPPQPAADGGNDDDAGDLSINSERMEKIYEKLKEPDPWPNRFARLVKDRHDGVSKKLDQVKQKTVAAQEKFETELSPLLKSALGGVGEQGELFASTLPVHVQFLGAEGQPYCDSLVSLMKQADALLFAYDQLLAREPQVSRLQDLRASFKRDKEVASATVEAGKRVARADIDRLLADGLHEVQAPSGLSAEEKQRGRMLLQQGSDQESSAKEPLGWGNVARDVERAIEKLCFAI